jgi:DNA-binding transcriptional regulator YdaS (Cro superfamily)
MDDGLRLAIKAAGGIRALGRLLGMHYQSIQLWERVPAEKVVLVEEKTGVARERLRPDLYRIPGNGAPKRQA